MSLVADLSENQIQEAREVFSYHCKGETTLGGDPLHIALRSCGVNPTVAEIQKVTGGEAVEFPKFLEVVGTSASSNAREEILQAFKLYDRAGKGTISQADLKHILSKSGDMCNSAEVKWAMKQASGDPVNYAAFVDKIFQGVPDAAAVGGGSVGGGSSAPPARAPARAAPPPAASGGDDFGGGFGDDDDEDDGDEFGF